MTQTNPDPSLTHTITTREAGEGVERCQCDELRAENERLRAQVACEDDAAETIWAQKKKRDAVVADLRARLARAEAIEAAADELLDYFAGMNTQSNYLLGLIDQLKAAKKTTEDVKAEPTLETVSSSDPCPECGSSKWTPNGDCPMCVERDASPDYAQVYRRLTPEESLLAHDNTPEPTTPTQTEAEVERLRGEVEKVRQDWNMAMAGNRSLTASLEMARGENKRLKADVDRSIEINNGLERENTRLTESLASFTARNADLRAKLDALVGAVDGLGKVSARRYTPAYDLKLATLHHAADAARQPTEAP